MTLWLRLGRFFLWKKVGFEDIIYIGHVYKKESAIIYEKV